MQQSDDRDYPAMPTTWWDIDSIGEVKPREVYPGLTKRERAAIDLRVADSGSAWLDDMIRQANRRELEQP